MLMHSLAQYRHASQRLGKKKTAAAGASATNQQQQHYYAAAQTHNVGSSGATARRTFHMIPTVCWGNDSDSDDGVDSDADSKYHRKRGPRRQREQQQRRPAAPGSTTTAAGVGATTYYLSNPSNSYSYRNHGGSSSSGSSRSFLLRYGPYVGGAALVVAVGILLGRWMAFLLLPPEGGEGYYSMLTGKSLVKIDESMTARDLENMYGRKRTNLLERSSSSAGYGATRRKAGVSLAHRSALHAILNAWLSRVDRDIINNVPAGIRWIRPYLLPRLPNNDDREGSSPSQTSAATAPSTRTVGAGLDKHEFLHVKRMDKVPAMKWEEEWERMVQDGTHETGPAVDYTRPNKYTYPDLVDKVPPASQYPVLKTLRQLMSDWDQDDDFEGTIHESLMHFDYNDPRQMEAARMFRNAEVPFKVTNVPDLLQASAKWNDDEYVAQQFGSPGTHSRVLSSPMDKVGTPLVEGVAQESPSSFFSFFTSGRWDVDSMGIPPTRNNDWAYEQWAKHARYADAIRLKSDQPHFYWQAGVEREERYQDESRWSFITRDLPSFSSRTETFFVFHPSEQKGVQCRFGERGITAAIHYDSGRNSVGMITGAKRYILAPPKECSKLGITTNRKSAIYRHSLLNFAHLSHFEGDKAADGGDGMSEEEREWLERASHAQAVETVVKPGEVLYIPSHWFHYIIGLQKNAQCNVRAGTNKEGHPVFGNRNTVEQCADAADS